VKAILLRVTLIALLLALAASTADAQRRARRRPAAAVAGPRWGAHIGYNFDADDLLLGAQVSWPITRRVDLYPSFDLYLVDTGHLWALNFDVKYRPPSISGSWYLGGGINILDRTAGSSTNLNLLTGLEGRRGRTRPYVEAKLILGDGSAFQLVGGFSWR
jgi:hypothetical protein